MSDEAKVEFIDYQDPISIRVGNAILEKGFGVANTEGYRAELSESDAIGILHTDIKIRKSWGFTYTIRHYAFLGILYFTTEKRSANSQNWVFEMYGRKYVELVKTLADELVQEFGISITIRLLSECSEEEKFAGWGFL